MKRPCGQGDISPPRSHSPQYALIADDLTGALDAGAGFARAGLRTSLPFSGRLADAGEADVILINTETRELDARAARVAVGAAARTLRAAGIPRVYKKMDSVLRGHPGPELAAVLEVYGGRALVAPAFPAQGRTTVDGIQRLGGQPVTSYGGQVAGALGEAAPWSDVRDASTDEDLARLAREGATGDRYRVWCGAAGLAAQAPRALDLTGRGLRPPIRPRPERVLVIAGTIHPATRVQVGALVESGWPHLLLQPETATDAARSAPLRQALAQLLSQRAGVVVSFFTGFSAVAGTTAGTIHGNSSAAGGAALTASPSAVVAALAAMAGALPLQPGLGLVVTGGETALHVCRGLGATAIHVTGEAAPGIPLGVLALPHGELAIATKSGGFGGPDALQTAAAALREG